MATRVSLRPVEPTDLPVLFSQQADAEAVRMAAFPARDHDAFLAHWRNILSDPRLVARTIMADRAVAGHIGSWPHDEERMVGYWIGREFWGRGVATAALRLFLREVPHRPLVARVARHNAASIRVLRKCGFMAAGDDTFTGADGRPVGEFIFRLDAPTAYASPACSLPEIED